MEINGMWVDEEERCCQDFEMRPTCSLTMRPAAACGRLTWRHSRFPSCSICLGARDHGVFLRPQEGLPGPRFMAPFPRRDQLEMWSPQRLPPMHRAGRPGKHHPRGVPGGTLSSTGPPIAPQLRRTLHPWKLRIFARCPLVVKKAPPPPQSQLCMLEMCPPQVGLQTRGDSRHGGTSTPSGGQASRAPSCPPRVQG